MIKTEDYHSEQGAIKIIAKIKVTYICELEYQTRIDCGFNALQIQGQSQQLSQTETNWHTSAEPEEYFNRPRLLTMSGVGLSYNHNEDALQVEDSPTRLEPPRADQTNLAASISRDLQRDFLPNVTPIAPNNSQTTASYNNPTTSTPTSVPFRFKRKSMPPKEPPLKLKKLIVTYGNRKIITDSTGTPVFPNYYRVDSIKGTIASDTSLSDDTQTQVLSREQNARDQLRDNNPLDDTAGVWKKTDPYGASNSD